MMCKAEFGNMKIVICFRIHYKGGISHVAPWIIRDKTRDDSCHATKYETQFPDFCTVHAVKQTCKRLQNLL